MNGKIVKLEAEHGMILPEGDNHELFFKKENLAPGTAITDLTIGTRVSLELAIGELGPHASNVMADTLEATVETKEHHEVSAEEVCVNRLLASKPLIEKVIEDAIIEEERLIDEKEAIKYLVLSATTDGVNLDSLILTEVFRDKSGAIIKLEAKSTDEKTGNYKLFTYKIKRAESVDETNVDVSSWEKDSEYPHSGDTLVKYVEGQWLLFDDSQPKGQKWVAADREE